jgi:glutamine synthetase type III
MTYEAEMKEFLQAKKMPADEGTYPEELMTQITIEAFDELANRIQELVDQLEDDADELRACEKKLEDKQDIIQEIRDLVTT